MVQGYKDIENVGKAFRCLKQVDLKVRPIFLRNTDHVKAHIFLCTGLLPEMAHAAEAGGIAVCR